MHRAKRDVLEVHPRGDPAVPLAGVFTRLLVGEGARFISASLVAGLALAIGVMRLVSTMLFGIDVGNVATFAQVSAVVASASVLASALATVRVRS